MTRQPDGVIARERAQLALALVRAAEETAAPRPRRLVGLRKVSKVVQRTAVSAGCFGEVIQWRLARKRP